MRKQTSYMSDTPSQSEISDYLPSDPVESPLPPPNNQGDQSPNNTTTLLTRLVDEIHPT